MRGRHDERATARRIRALHGLERPSEIVQLELGQIGEEEDRPGVGQPLQVRAALPVIGVLRIQATRDEADVDGKALREYAAAAECLHTT